jgi:ABC-type sugar transport system ATPase subunit
MLELKRISKSFQGVPVLKDVSITVQPGEIHALVGENGAGKSTLIKTIAGVLQPNGGTLCFDGIDTRWASPGEAKKYGVHVIYQEFVLFPLLSVAENIFLGNERSNSWGLLDRRRMNSDALALLAQLGVTLDPTVPVGDLSVADQQMVEIAKALAHEVKLLILDEPTAVISGPEVVALFARLRNLRDAGVTIIYVSHRLEEIFELCKRVTVLKDGEVVGTRDVSEVSQAELVAMMVGRKLSDLFPPKRVLRADAEVVLTARNLCLAERVKGCSIQLRAGEITALAGMVGAGRTELAMGLFGGMELQDGDITIDGNTYRKMTPSQAIQSGIGLLTENRKTEGLAIQLDVAANVTAASLADISRYGFLDFAAERATAAKDIINYRIVCQDSRTPVTVMSGGNQQKVLLARWARNARRVLILDEPTRGVDVGAKAEIYRMLHELANKGLAILMISSELPEVVGMADRVLVMREGEITGELQGDDINEHTIMALATRAKVSATKDKLEYAA